MNHEHLAVKIETSTNYMPIIVKAIVKCEQDAGGEMWDDILFFRVQQRIIVAAPLNKAQWILRELRRTHPSLVNRIFHLR